MMLQSCESLWLALIVTGALFLLSMAWCLHCFRRRASDRKRPAPDMPKEAPPPSRIAHEQPAALRPAQAAPDQTAGEPASQAPAPEDGELSFEALFEPPTSEDSTIVRAIREKAAARPGGKVPLAILDLYGKIYSQPGSASFPERDVLLEAMRQLLFTFAKETNSRGRGLSFWVDMELLPFLADLAKRYATVFRTARRGNGGEAERDLLQRALFSDINEACTAEGLFSIMPIELYRTSFDHRRHEALAGEDDPEAIGLVVNLWRLGRVTPGTGAILEKAQVIVGR